MIMIRPYSRTTLLTILVRHSRLLFLSARGVIAREHLGTLKIGPKGGSSFYGATARGEVSAVWVDGLLFMPSHAPRVSSFSSGLADKGAMPHILDARG